MFTEEQLKQLGELIEQKLAPLPTRDELKAAVEPLATKEQVAAAERKLDQAQEDISEILTVVIEHHDKLE